MKILSKKHLTASAPGKAILIGEHSVVYGYKAIAMALPDVRLQMTLMSPEDSQNIYSWEQAWQTIVSGKSYEPQPQVKELLVKAFEKALFLCHVSEPLSSFQPQKLLVESDIPLGGGMGGSAAISTCLLKIASHIALSKNIIDKELTLEQQIQYANEIDCLFHFGKASGLDVATIASNGIIEFAKGSVPKYIQNGHEFWLAFVDSKERGETALMVKRVAERLNKFPEKTNESLSKIGTLVEKSISGIMSGNIRLLAQYLNQAQEHLSDLGVSTKKIEQIISQLKSAGALAAKLTGAGGGGLILGLFEQKPENLYTLFNKESLFITRVPKYDAKRT